MGHVHGKRERDNSQDFALIFPRLSPYSYKLCLSLVSHPTPERRETGMAWFKNREDAGKQLAGRLSNIQSEAPVILAVPRGGVPVALPIASAFNAPLGVVPMRKLSVPWLQDVAIGYVTNQGDLHLDQPLIGQLRITPQEVHRMSKKEELLLLEDLKHWKIIVPSTLSQKTALIIDDGMHSGWTMFSAVETVRKLGAKRIIVGIPVSHFRAKRFVGHHCDDIISLVTEDVALFEIANYYEDFPEISDDRIRSMLRAGPPHSDQTAA